MNKFIVSGMICVFMLLEVESGHAGLFARGGGESRTITAISPQKIINSVRQSLVISGHFSSKQGRKRRVVFYLRRVPRPVPAHVSHWGSKRITVTLPAHLTPGAYVIYLERDFGHNGQHQWHAISNKQSFLIDAAPVAGQIRGHYMDSVCNGRWQRLQIIGGPFDRGTTIRPEIRAHNPVSGSRPTVSVVSNTELEVKVPPCLAIKNGVQLRLAFPNGTKSNWISIEQPWAR